MKSSHLIILSVVTLGVYLLWKKSNETKAPVVVDEKRDVIITVPHGRPDQTPEGLLIPTPKELLELKKKTSAKINSLAGTTPKEEKSDEQLIKEFYSFTNDEKKLTKDVLNCSYQKAPSIVNKTDGFSVLTLYATCVGDASSKYKKEVVESWVKKQQN